MSADDTSHETAMMDNDEVRYYGKGAPRFRPVK